MSALRSSEQHVMAADAPAVVLIDRALIRALLRYVRRLERDAGRGILGDPRAAITIAPRPAIASARGHDIERVLDSP